MSNIIIQTTTTAQDYKKLVFFNMFLKKKLMMFLMPIAAVISLAAVIGKSLGIIEMSDWYYTVCLVFLGLLVLLLFAFELTVKRFIASDRLVINNERTITISDLGILEEGGIEKSKGEFRWELMFQAFETKHFFYIYINTVQAIILPKRDFRSGEIIEAEKLIEEKLSGRFVKR